MAQHPELYRVYVPVIAKVIPHSELPPRDREILALRTLARCSEVYEATHHASIARHAGLTDADIEAARTSGPGLSPFERTLVRAVDELMTDYTLSDTTWRALGERYSQVQQMEVVGLVGCYVMLAMIMKSYGIQLEDDETFKRCQAARGYE
jgi:alkylhydroperoxidase family enzyme